MLVDDAYRTLRGDAFWQWYLRAGQWATEGLMPRPAPGTILAEAPPFPMDSIQSKTFVVTNDTTQPFAVDLEHRDPTNTANVNAQRLVVPARSQLSVTWTTDVRMSERWRIRAA